MRKFKRKHRKRPGEDKRQALYDFIFVFSDLTPRGDSKPVALLMEPIFSWPPRPPEFPEPNWPEAEPDEWTWFCWNMEDETREMVGNLVSRIYPVITSWRYDSGAEGWLWEDTWGLSQYLGWYTNKSEILGKHWVGARWQDLRPAQGGREVKLAIRASLQELHNFLFEFKQRMKEKHGVTIEPEIIFPQIFSFEEYRPDSLDWFDISALSNNLQS